MRSLPFPLSPAAEFPNDNPELHLGTIWTLDEPRGVVTPERRGSSSTLRDAATASVTETPTSDASLGADVPCATTSGVRLVTLGEGEGEVPERAPAPAKDPHKKELPIQEPPSRKPAIEEPPGKTPRVDDPAIDEPPAPVDDPKVEMVEALDVRAVASVYSPGAVDGATNVEGFAVLVRAMSKVVTSAGVVVEEACFFDLFVIGKTPLADLPRGAVVGLVAAGYAEARGDTLFTRDAVLAVAAAWRAILRDEAADFAVCGSKMLDEWAADIVAHVTSSPQKTEAFRRELRAHGVAAFGLLASAA